jgi:hypothetical protein
LGFSGGFMDGGLIQWQWDRGEAASSLRISAATCEHNLRNRGVAVTLLQASKGRNKGAGSSMEPNEKAGIDGTIFGEIQLILAEKRTALSTLRTGIALFALPLSVLSVLVATSRYYDPARVLHFLLPLLALCLGLVVLGSYLIIHSMLRVRHYDKLIRELKRTHSAISQFLD